MAWQVARLNTADPASCLRLFRLNRETGLLVLLALFAAHW
jgi:4-hydroxybenzoate polyprenyltransferase